MTEPCLIPLASADEVIGSGSCGVPPQSKTQVQPAFVFFYAGQKASEDNRNAVTTDTDLDKVVHWVRMKVPSRNSDFLILASPCRFWPMFLQRKRSSPLLLEAY